MNGDRKLRPGITRMGHRIENGRPAETVSLTIRTDGVEVLTASAESPFGALHDRLNPPLPPEPVIFADAEGFITLHDGVLSGAKVQLLTGASLQRIRYGRAILTGQRGCDYDGVDGMRSEVDGLAAWSGVSAVKQTFTPEGETEPRIELIGQNVDPVPLGGPFNLTLTTGIRHNPTPEDYVYSIRDILTVRTESAAPKPWYQHKAQHRMVQDLMCLAFGRACASRLVSVKREDDQAVPPRDAKRFWYEAYEPSFGRTFPPDATWLRRKDLPLFRLTDTDLGKVDQWLSDTDWGRPTWIAVGTLFQQGLTVEVRLLQIGVALEALGYAIWTKSTKSESSGTPGYPDLLRIVTAEVPIAHDALWADGDPDSWCTGFNNAFKGAKHADNPLPDALTAHRCATQGMTLIRCWLALTLGVAPATVQANLDRTT